MLCSLLAVAEFLVRSGKEHRLAGRLWHRLDNWMAPWKNWTSQYISFFPPITQWCSVSDVLFTGGR